MNAGSTSSLAIRTHELFVELNTFFQDRQELSRALAWDMDEVNTWLDAPASSVDRSKQAEVQMLLEMCEELEPFSEQERKNTGVIVLETIPELGNVSPAAMLRELGRDAIMSVRCALVDSHMNLPFEPVEHIDIRIVDQVLTEGAGPDPGVKELVRILNG